MTSCREFYRYEVVFAIVYKKFTENLADEN